MLENKSQWRCTARSHALAVWHRYAPPRSTALAHARAPLGGQMRSAPAQHTFFLIEFFGLLIDFD